MKDKNWIRLRIKNNRKQQLAALFLKSKPGKGSDRQKSGANPLVIVCHGFTGSKEGRGQALAMGEQLALLLNDK